MTVSTVRNTDRVNSICLPLYPLPFVPYALKLFADLCNFRWLYMRSWSNREYFNPANFGARCCVIVEMDIERTRTCPFLPLLSSQRLWVQIPPARRRLSVAHLAILVGSVQRRRFVPNPGQAARSARVGNGGFFFYGQRLTSCKGLSKSTIARTPKEERTRCFTKL